MSWQAESYQFVAFHPPHEVQDAFQIWLGLFQASPDNYQRHPDPNANATLANGKHAGYFWQVQCSPGRVDLFLMGQPAVIPDQANPSSFFPVIPNATAGLDLLRQQLVRPLLDKLPVTRMAVVVQFFEDHPSYRSANEAFLKLTGAPIDPVSALDVMFSVNVRKGLDEYGVALNRVCRWQTIEKQLVQVQINTGIAEGLPQIVQHSLLLNIDINTMHQQTAIRSSTRMPIAERLFEELEGLKEGGYEKLNS